MDLLVPMKVKKIIPKTKTVGGMKYPAFMISMLCFRDKTLKYTPVDVNKNEEAIHSRALPMIPVFLYTFTYFEFYFLVSEKRS